MPFTLAARRQSGSRTAGTTSASRVASLDALRGLVMVIMALDHVRDFFHADAASFSPTDLSKTTPVLFLTRWITHFCLPVFMFAAGAGAFLWCRQKGHTRAQLSRLLWTRGLWFVFLELTVMQFAFNFNVSPGNLVLLLILWIFGVCMLLFSGLVWLPFRWLIAFGIAVVALHNGLDRINAAQFGSASWLWMMLHQPGLFTAASVRVLVTYTILPWIGVLALGFCFGSLLLREPEHRQRVIRGIGWSLVIAFLIIRAIDRYGDPAPWQIQKSTLFTLLSFLNCTKYPGSLDFLLMTMGPALLMLVRLDRLSLSPANPLVVFGRVPMFYFILHFYLIHALVAVLAFIRYGSAAASFVFHPVPSMGGPRQLFPPDFGYSLWVTYIIWIAVVIALYPVCKWFARIKATRRPWWLTYL